MAVEASAGRLGYLGPEGTFTHQAALDLRSPGDELVPFARPEEVIRAVDSAAVDRGVVAFESSIEGSVPASLDELLLTGSRALIAGERILQVTFSIWRAPQDRAPLVGVSSHPFALSQCSRALRELEVLTEEATSTAAACRDLRARPREGWGAIAPRVAGELYGLRSERDAIEDNSAAQTRFILLADTAPPPTGRDRSAFGFRPNRDEPGSLVGLLQEFSIREINLTAIKSRPTRDSLGDYIFYIECEGHVADPRVRAAVLGLLRAEGQTRFLGSFPEDERRPTRPPSPSLDERDRAYEAMLERTLAGEP